MGYNLYQNHRCILIKTLAKKKNLVLPSANYPSQKFKKEKSGWENTQFLYFWVHFKERIPFKKLIFQPTDPTF